MAIIKEDYVSFETAKLLKEKGFGGDCLSMYVTPKPHSGMGNPNEAKIAPHGKDSHYYEGYLYQCEAPTLQMAMKWLREVHNINIDIVPIWNQKRFEYQVFVITPENAKHCYIDDELYLDYEQACDTAIKYCLENLI